MKSVTEHSIHIGQLQITALHHRLKDGLMTHSLSVSGHLDRKLAQRLSCADLVFLPNGTPRQGFPQLPLDVECGAFRAVFEAAPELRQQFEITGDTCSHFLVKRTDNGSLQLHLRLNYHGDPHPALAYIEVVGSGPSTLAISPLEQQKLFSPEAEDAEAESARRSETAEEETPPVAEQPYQPEPEEKPASRRRIPVPLSPDQERSTRRSRAPRQQADGDERRPGYS